MNYCEKIPSKTEAVKLTGENIKIDAAGLEAVVAVYGGKAYIKANPETGDENAFVLDEGNTITLNGCFYLSGNGADVRILYCRTV